MMTFRTFLLIAWMVLVSAALGSAGEKPWIEVRSPHFRVLTNGGPGEARHVAEEFEQMRYVFATRFPGARLDSGAPLSIFAARDEETAKALEPAWWKSKGSKPAGVFHHAWQKQYVMVRLDTWGEHAHEPVYHEYTHSILHMNSHWLPLWLDEGVAEFYAYTRFEQHKIYIGAPTERYKTLRGKTPMPVETLISVNQRSPYYHDEDKVDLFYAESWALVHYLTFGSGMEGGKRLDQFFGLLQQGMEQKKAFVQVFGEFSQVDKALTSYMQQLTFAAGILKDPPQFDDKAFTSRTLSLAETEAELGGFHLWTHDLADARPLFERALKDDPKLGLAHEGTGFVQFADGKDAEAASEFSQAYTLDGSLYLSLFAKTMLSPLPASQTVSDMNAFGQTLGKVLQLNPQFAPAYAQLARLALREDDPNSALMVARRAEDLEPSLAGYHLLSGQILLRLGKGSEAAAYAKYVTERWHGPDHNEAVELWNAVPLAQRPPGESVAEESPKDTQTLTGAVKQVTCADQDQGWAFVITRDGQALTFHRKGGFPFGFSDTLWYGEDHFSLCHHLEGKRAIVHYRPASDTSYAGDVAEIEIRDDLSALAGANREAVPAAKP